MQLWRSRGVDITAETGEQYIFLDADSLLPTLGSILRMNPPVRERKHGAALLAGLLDGSIDTVASDHSPHTREEKVNDNIWEAASGFVSVETSLSVFLSEAVNTGLMTLEMLVRLASTNPARLWGLYPQKGSLTIGADGDLTIIDLEHRWIVDEAQLHSKTAVTPFQGMQLLGKPVGTIVRGRPIVLEGELIEPEPSGQFVAPVHSRR
jgi:dihydroorotase